MSRSNKNNRKKIKFFKSENETHCSSSSSSSNSDDGDVIKNIPNKASFANKNHGTFMGGSEAPSEEVFFEYLVPKDENLSDMLKSYINTENNDASHTDMKIGRIRSLSSNEIKILLIVDVLENKLLKDDVNYDNYRIGRIDVESSKQEERPNDMNIKRKIKSRRIFKLSEELTKKFDEKELKVFERHSFTKPDDVMKLLLSDDNLKSVASKFDDVDKKSTIFKRDFETNQFEPINKKIKCTKESTFCDTKSYTFPYYGLDPSNNVRFRTNVNHRTRLLHKFLKECYAPKMQQTNKFTDRRCNSTITKNENRDATLQERWKLLRDFAVLQENVENVNVLLGEDNVKAVSSNVNDTSTTDGNNDALNNSNDDDSKSKKKNRCALCRKKVGLTGFECRCGGLYCGMHRYSDKHNCTFDYRQLGAQEIRRNNPVVIGEKIQKI